MAFRDYFNEWGYSDSEAIIERIKDYQYVSFDVFDTLFKRDVGTPHRVFDLVGDTLQLPDFSTVRIATERFVRQQVSKEEITIDDIYENMPSSFHECKEKELSIEREILRPSSTLMQVYRYCKAHQKRVIVISDMYLPEDFFIDLFRRHDIQIDGIFISSSYGVQKRSGNLFKLAIEKLQIDRSQMIHIGDSPKADYLGAKRAGIATVLIAKTIRNTGLISVDNDLNCFINNHVNLSKSIYYQIGFSSFGPVLYGFVRWLHNQLEKNRIEKVFFFSRDGYLMKTAYENIYGKSEFIKYIYVSRRSLSVPLLWKHSEWSQFYKYITMTRYFSVESFLDRLGLEPEKYVQRLSGVGLNLRDVFTEKTFLSDARLQEFYAMIHEDVIKNSKQEYLNCIQYFRENDFSGKLAIVDIGWNGSMQKYLDEMIKLAGMHVEMTGYYFGVKKNMAPLNACGYLYEYNDTAVMAQLSFMQGLFESFFLSQEGSVKRYENSVNRHVIPVLYASEYDEKSKEYISLREVQEGALQFCREYDFTGYVRDIRLDASTSIRNLLRFGNSPSVREVEFFGDFRFFDTNIVYMAFPERWYKYILHPSKFFMDFSYAVWKAGFLKRLLRVRLPYFRLYLYIKLLAK